MGLDAIERDVKDIRKLVKARIMLALLIRDSDITHKGKLPEPGSKKWKTAKNIIENIYKEFED